MSVVGLHAEVMGQGKPLVILHGLFGSARNWGSISRRLADICQVHALDLRNHGSSPWDAQMTYELMAADVAAYIDSHGLAPADILGHSMGGKTAMVLALRQPALIDRLIVVDIAPVPYQHDSFYDFLAAMQAVDTKQAHRRTDVDQQLAKAIPDNALRAFLLQNLISEQGHFRWRVNLTDIDANLPAIIGFPELDGRFDGPATFLAGERSDYIRPRDEAAIRRLFPKAKLYEIGQSGHWPHAEQPDRFTALVRHALAE